MKPYVECSGRGVEGGRVDSYFLDCGTTWRWEVSFTFPPPYTKRYNINKRMLYC